MRIAVAAVCLLLGGCSLILDFSTPPVAVDAGPPDAIDTTACDFGEPNEDTGHAFALSPVTAQPAAICVLGDHDYYAFDVLDGQMVSFQITFAQDGASGDLDMLMYKMGSASVVARSVSTDANEGIVCPGEGPHCPALSAGTYYVDVYGYEDLQVNTYSIDFSVTGP